MNEEWKNPINKKKNKKNKLIDISNDINKSSNIEETYFLSNLLDDGTCLSCMKGYCKINEPHGKPFPNRFCTFVQNPLYIETINELIKKEDLNFSDKKTYFSICKDINRNCKNCEEGRVKYIPVNGKYIFLCFPVIDNTKSKITVGIHTDLKLVMKGNNYDISIIPIDIIFEDDYYEDNYYEDNSLENNWPDLVKNNTKKEDLVKKLDFTKIKGLFKNNDVKDNDVKVNDVKVNDVKVNDVKVNDVKVNDVKVNDVKVNEIKDNEINNVNEIKNNKMNDINRNLDKIENNKKTLSLHKIKYNDNLIDTVNNDSNLEYNNYLLNLISNLEDQTKKIKDENYELKNENIELINQNIELKNQIKILKKNNSNIKFINDNENLYKEFLFNIRNLNNIIVKQYVETHCSKYIVD